MFTHARIKLTAWYLLIIMIISVFFSIAIYEVLTKELDRFANIQRIRIDRRFHTNSIVPPDVQLRFSTAPNIEPELIEETKDRLIIYLIILNAGILFISGVFGYVLAGRTLKPIKNMIDEQNQFISDASHELRTPLTSLKSAFEVYLRDNIPTIPESKILVKESIIEVNKLQSLSESLLQLAQYQKPNSHTSFQKILLKNIVESAIRKMAQIARKKKITIKHSVTDVEFEGNEYGLVDAIVIILDNAIKYSKSGGTINIDADRNDGSVIIKITDHGIGIDKKDISFIFNRFYRADNVRSKIDTNGYGLGLSIAKQIINSHRGQIIVKSEFGKGSEFSIRLPVKQLIR